MTKYNRNYYCPDIPPYITNTSDIYEELSVEQEYPYA